MVGTAETHARTRKRIRARLRAAGVCEDEIAYADRKIAHRQRAARQTGRPIGGTWTRYMTGSAIVRWLSDGSCAYCGRAIYRAADRHDGWPTVDHVHPRARGGSSDPENLVMACQQCNGDKGDRTLVELGWAMRPDYLEHRARAGWPVKL